MPDLSPASTLAPLKSARRSFPTVDRPAARDRARREIPPTQRGSGGNTAAATAALRWRMTASQLR